MEIIYCVLAYAIFFSHYTNIFSFKPIFAEMSGAKNMLSSCEKMLISALYIKRDLIETLTAQETLPVMESEEKKKG